MLLFREIFHLLVEQTNVYHQQHLDKLDLAADCKILRCDMMTFIALVLQIGHEFKDKLHDYWSRLRQLHNPFYGETMAHNRFFIHFVFCILQTIHRDLTKAKIMTDYRN